MKAKLTYDLAHAAGTDAGNRNMRKRNGTSWNEEDFDVACLEENRILGIIESETEKTK
jgi:hypothetical protein